MGPRRPARASQTELIRRLDAEWRLLAGSRLLRERLQYWAASDERLAFDDGDQLATAAQRRDAASWAERDQVLAALLDLATEDALARRVALHVVLPGVKSLINGIRCWDVEERAARRGGHRAGCHFLVCHRAGGDSAEFPNLCEYEAPGPAIGAAGTVGAGGIRRRLPASRCRRGRLGGPFRGRGRRATRGVGARAGAGSRRRRPPGSDDPGRRRLGG